MPYYTIGTSVTQEATGDSVGGGTIPSTATFTITPDAGYVLDATGFSASTPLPTGVSSVAFTNSTTAFALGNVVNVTATYANSLAMASVDITLNIGICETDGVQVHVSVSVVVKFKVTTLEMTNLGGTSTVSLPTSTYHSSTKTTTSTTTNDSGSITTFGITGSYGNVFTNRVHTVTSTIDPNSGPQTVIQGTVTLCHSSEDPKVCLVHSQSSAPNCLSYDPTGYICDITPELYSQFLSLPNNFNGYIETLYYNSSGFVNKFDWSIDFEGYTQAQLNATNYTSADMLAASVVSYGLTNNTTWSTLYSIHKFEDDRTTLTTDGWDIPVSPLGETRNLSVTGDPGATFSVTFVNASNVSILSSAITNVVMPSNGRYDWAQVFPASGTTTTYTLVVAAGTNTTLSSLFTSRSPSATFVYDQISGTPSITLSGTSSSSFSSSTTASFTGFAPNFRFGPTNNSFPVSMTITRTGGGSLFITRQPNWSGDWSNSNSSTNGGTSLDLSMLSITGSGTSTLTLAGTASRSVVGTTNVNMALNLDSFIDTGGGSSTDVTSIALNTTPIASGQFAVAGGGITINSVILPTNATTTALTWSVSGSGFVVTPSTDTLSAVVTSASTAGTRTVTATATDGSNVTGTISVIAAVLNLETVEDTISVYAGRTTVIDITANDQTQGGGCTVVVVSSPTIGSVGISGQTVSYNAPDTNVEQISFTYKLQKSGFTDSNTSTVVLTLIQN